MNASPDPLPGDEIIERPDVVMDRRMLLLAPPETIWPWLVQLGKNRAGWYLPGVVERWFIPTARRAIRRIEPQWQDIKVGDVVDDWGGKDAKFTLASIDPPHSIVWTSTRARKNKGPLFFTWALVLQATGKGSSELRLRLRIDNGGGRKWLAQYGGGALDLATVKLLERGLKERLESA